eukprot:363429-Chlamydomonas_euryale.AAC.24
MLKQSSVQRRESSSYAQCTRYCCMGATPRRALQLGRVCCDVCYDLWRCMCQGQFCCVCHGEPQRTAAAALPAPLLLAPSLPLSAPGE